MAINDSVKADENFQKASQLYFQASRCVEAFKSLVSSLEKLGTTAPMDIEVYKERIVKMDKALLSTPLFECAEVHFDFFGFKMLDSTLQKSFFAKWFPLGVDPFTLHSGDD